MVLSLIACEEMKKKGEKALMHIDCVHNSRFNVK